MSQTSVLLAAPTSGPKVVPMLRQQGHQSELEYALHFTLRHTLQFCRRSRAVVLSTSYLFLVYFTTFLRAAFAACSVLLQWAWPLLLLLCTASLRTAVVCAWAAAPGATRCKTKARLLKRKFEMELSGFVFGPVGNGLALLVMWPGWLVILAVWGTAKLAMLG